MGYEFEDVYMELILKNCKQFNNLIEELIQIPGTAWMPGELYTERDGYASLIYEDDFNKEDYPNLCYLDIKHRGCFKWHNMEEWLKIFNKYCLGELMFTGDYGESVIVEFTGDEDYLIQVEEYRVIQEEDWNKGFQEHYYKD